MIKRTNILIMRNSLPLAGRSFAGAVAGQEPFDFPGWQVAYVYMQISLSTIKHPIHILSGQGALLFIKFMPHIHSIRGRLEEVSDALSQILEAPVKVRPKMVQRTIRAQKPNRLGNMRLGANSVNVGVLNSAEADYAYTP